MKLKVMWHKKIPGETIRRLPIYLRNLLFLSEHGRDNISSQNLADFMGVQSCQIRKDFSYFGDFGVRGVGYDIKGLTLQIEKILKLNISRKAALVGVGNLGKAILAYPGFDVYGFNLAAAFDVDSRKIGRKIKDIKIQDISKISALRRQKIKLAIIAVPRQSAQQTADSLVKAGVTGILNFSPCYIAVPKKIKVITIDIAMDLARLPYYMPAG
jgi:redox-sensing transcriptional repressor